jgi:hypothetical protein
MSFALKVIFVKISCLICDLLVKHLFQINFSKIQTSALGFFPTHPSQILYIHVLLEIK